MIRKVLEKILMAQKHLRNKSDAIAQLKHAQRKLTPSSACSDVDGLSRHNQVSLVLSHCVGNPISPIWGRKEEEEVGQP